MKITIKSIISPDKTNNKITNLEWVNQSENIQHALKFKDVKNRRPVAQLNKDGILIAIYHTLKDAAKEFNAHPCNIINVCKGKCETSMGYKWTYIGTPKGD